jgi:hypothetical protein
MKMSLVIDMPNEYADRYNVNEMYVWNMVVQDKQGYEMFDLTTDKPWHLKPLPHKRETKKEWFNEYHRDEFVESKKPNE